jgi:hypothetical protein
MDGWRRPPSKGELVTRPMQLAFACGGSDSLQRKNALAEKGFSIPTASSLAMVLGQRYTRMQS